MTRPLRISFPGALYHVTMRGNAGADIFQDEVDRAGLLTVLGDTAVRYNWLCYAYCLMTNHYHLVVETPDGNLSLGMRQLNGVYTQRFNKRHKRPGHVFQGRFKAILVEKERYLFEVCRYVVLNPVRAGLIMDPSQWAWSSYQATVNASKTQPWLAHKALLSRFGREAIVARREYREFILDGLGKASPWQNLKERVFLGGDSFAEKVRHVLKGKELMRDVARVERFAGRPALDAIFAGAPKLPLSPEKVYAAHVRHGYTFAEIARHLRVHPATASKAYARCDSARRLSL